MNFERLRKHFLDYAASYIDGAEGELARNCILKRDHTLHVLEEAEYLLRELGIFSGMEYEAVRTAALFHDYGRFEQLRLYGTFADCDSVDHGHLSAQLICRHGVLRDFAPDLRRDIAGAVAVHNAREIPDALKGRARAFCEIVRDADKIDIFRVIADYLAHPDNAAVMLSLRGNYVVSEKVLAALEAHREISHRDLKTPGDFLAAKLHWPFELSSGAARRRLRETGYFEKLLEYLPCNLRIDRLKSEAIAALER